MQPDSLDEDRPWIDQSDLDVGAQPQVVGGQRAGVSSTDHDDVSALVGHCFLLFSWVCCPPDTAEAADVTGFRRL
jgi:hypothetical protein